MRINPKIFLLGDKATPLDVQDVDGRKVEIFCLNDFEDLYNQNLGKSKFAVWSSEDGFNYRIFIEKGYYAELADLYSVSINRIWLNFWDSCEKISNRFSYKIMMPITIGAVILYFILGQFIPDSYQIPFGIGVFGFVLIVMITLQRYTKQKIAQENSKSIDEIKAVYGKKHFEELLEKQKNYIEDFYNKMYADEEPSQLETMEAEVTNEKEVIEETTTADKEVVEETTAEEVTEEETKTE